MFHHASWKFVLGKKACKSSIIIIHIILNHTHIHTRWGSYLEAINLGVKLEFPQILDRVLIYDGFFEMWFFINL